jgi:hypothetical protein
MFVKILISVSLRTIFPDFYASLTAELTLSVTSRHPQVTVMDSHVGYTELYRKVCFDENVTLSKVRKKVTLSRVRKIVLIINDMLEHYFRINPGTKI